MLQHYTVMQVGYETTMCFSCFLIRCVCYWLTSYEIEVMLVLMSHRELNWAFFCFIQESLAGTGCCILENHIDSCCRMDYNSYQLATLFIPSNSCISVAKRAGDVCLVSLADMVVELQCSTKLFFTLIMSYYVSSLSSHLVTQSIRSPGRYFIVIIGYIS
jgi:hypothetical protein